VVLGLQENADFGRQFDLFSAPGSVALRQLLLVLQRRSVVKLRYLWVLIAAIMLVPSAAWAQVMSVKVKSATFRADPSKKGSVKFSAAKFYPVKILEKQKNWVKVSDFEGEDAWVQSNQLGKQKTVVIKANKGKVRQKPNTESKVAFEVLRGEVFKITERKGSWLHVVDINGEKGWVRSDLTWGISQSGKDAKAKKGVKKVDKKVAKKGEKKGKKGPKKAHKKTVKKNKKTSKKKKSS
jgi:SH3-like domain-containing protein